MLFSELCIFVGCNVVVFVLFGLVVLWCRWVML